MATLTSLVQSLAATACPPEQVHGLNLDSSFAKWLLANYVSEVGGEVKTLANALRSEESLSRLAQGNVSASPGSNLTTDQYSAAAHWLLAQARVRDGESALSELKAFVSSNCFELTEVLVLWGVLPTTPVQITDTIQLVPLRELHDSQPKDFFLGIKDTPHTQALSLGAPRPTAALIKPRIHCPFPDSASDLRRNSEPHTRSLLSIARCLPAALKTSVCHLAHWYEANPSTPFVGGVRGWSGQAFEHAFTRLPGATNIDSDRLRAFVTAFLALDARVSNRLSVPLDRLNRALRQHSATQIAIELGISIESLLTDDRPSDAPISFVLRQRAALLGSNIPSQRRELLHSFRRLYELRSKAVHGHDIDDDRDTADSSKGNTAFLMARAIEVAAMIEQIVMRGAFPDWDSLVFGAT
ncbi:MAG: hypothetical protein JNK28_15765 [Burkholderiaceae bacterium]|nr:hypothetical protein [Burkholderiaceae bacterium]